MLSRSEGYVPWTSHLILDLMINRKINNCPLPILDVLQFLTLKVKYPHPHMLLLKQISLLKWQNDRNVYLCQPGCWSCLQLWSYEEQPLVRDVSRQQMQTIKEAAILHPLQPLGHPQLLENKGLESQQDEGSAVQSCPWSACGQWSWSWDRQLTGTGAFEWWSKLGRRPWCVSMWPSLLRFGHVHH